MKEKYKLIAFDIDGTIKKTDQEVSSEIISSISQAKQLGTKVTVITGRSYLSAKDVISNLGLSAPIVTFQGAHIADSFTGNVFWKKIIDDFLLDELIEIFQNIDNEILFYTETEIFTNKISDWNNNYSRRNNSNLILLNNICELYEKEIIRITVICPSGAEEFANLIDSKTEGKLYVTASLQNFCEILHPKAGKKHGLQKLASLLNIDRKQILSFGNSNEDLSMLEWSGNGVIEKDKNINLRPNKLDHCDSIEHNGPSKYLKRLIDQDLLGK